MKGQRETSETDLNYYFLVQIETGGRQIETHRKTEQKIFIIIQRQRERQIYPDRQTYTNTETEREGERESTSEEFLSILENS